MRPFSSEALDWLGCVSDLGMKAWGGYETECRCEADGSSVSFSFPLSLLPADLFQSCSVSLRSFVRAPQVVQHLPNHVCEDFQSGHVC